MKPALFAAGLLLATLGTGCSGPELTGPAATYVDQGCAKCHGRQLEGTRTAPGLIGLTEHWTAEDLATYLRDPQPFLEASTRMRSQAEDYPIPMPAYPDLPDEDVQPLVEYLLTYQTQEE
jgi:cytochrome c553